MAVYRHVHVSFWQDSFVLDLTPEEKYFYLYLMTNSKTTQCGIYELPKRIIETETGYNRETVDKLLKRFIDYGKIEYNEGTKEVVLINWNKYNSSTSPKVKACIDKELQQVKHKDFIKYLYSIESLPIDLGEKQKQKQKQKEVNTLYPLGGQDIPPFSEIISYLNEKTEQAYRSSSKKTQTLIRARWQEGFRLDDFKRVIDNKTEQWLNDQNMCKFLRPETLFGTKFESYLNEKVVKRNGGQQGNGSEHRESVTGGQVGWHRKDA